MKIYKINFKFSATLLITLMVVSFFFVGCQNESNLNKDIDALPYLSLSNDKNSLNLSDADKQAFIKAYQRMEITQEDGLYKTKWTSGSQINISKDLFNMFKNGIIRSNQLNDKLKHKLVRFKTEGENGGASNDCVQQAIWSVMSTFGCSSSYTDVNDWVINTYGNNGVAPQFFGDACDHFLDGYKSTIYNGYGEPPSGQKIIVVLNNGTPEEHAGVLKMYTNGLVWYTDKNGDQTFFSTDNITCYIASGCE